MSVVGRDPRVETVLASWDECDLDRRHCPVLCTIYQRRGELSAAGSADEIFQAYEMAMLEGLWSTPHADMLDVAYGVIAETNFFCWRGRKTHSFRRSWAGGFRILVFYPTECKRARSAVVPRC